MRHLKKATVRTVIELASACPPEQEFSIEEIRAGAAGKLQTAPEIRAYNSFVSNLSDDETAELIALTNLGKGYEHKPEDFEMLVDEAYRDQNRTMFTLAKQKIPQYLRLGMERLARRKTGKKVPTVHNEERRRMLVGKFVMDHFLETYGKEHGYHKLVAMMEDAGYLDRAEDRKVFGLKESKVESELVKVIGGKRSSARIKLGPIRP